METQFRSAKFLGFDLFRRDDAFAIPSREITYMELTYCIEGSLEYVYHGERVVLRSGDAILYPPGSIRERIYTNGYNYYASFNVEFDVRFVPAVYGYLPQCIRPSTVRMLEVFLEEFRSVSPNKQEKCAAIFSYLYHQLTEITLDKENPVVRDVRQYLVNHMSERITLEQIAARAHLSPNYLCSLFKKETGLTIMEYLLQQRIEQAKRMIVTEDVALSQIAEKCGFVDYNHFSQTFRKLAGVTATQYRKSKDSFREN